MLEIPICRILFRPTPPKCPKSELLHKPKTTKDNRTFPIKKMKASLRIKPNRRWKKQTAVHWSVLQDYDLFEPQPHQERCARGRCRESLSAHREQWSKTVLFVWLVCPIHRDDLLICLKISRFLSNVQVGLLQLPKTPRFRRCVLRRRSGSPRLVELGMAVRCRERLTWGAGVEKMQNP